MRYHPSSTPETRGVCAALLGDAAVGVIRNVATRTLGLPIAKIVSRVFKNVEVIAFRSSRTRYLSRGVLKTRQN